MKNADFGEVMQILSQLSKEQMDLKQIHKVNVWIEQEGGEVLSSRADLKIILNLMVRNNRRDEVVIPKSSILAIRYENK